MVFFFYSSLFLPFIYKWGQLHCRWQEVGLPSLYLYGRNSFPEPHQCLLSVHVYLSLSDCAAAEQVKAWRKHPYIPVVTSYPLWPLWAALSLWEGKEGLTAVAKRPWPPGPVPQGARVHMWGRGDGRPWGWATAESSALFWAAGAYPM